MRLLSGKGKYAPNVPAWLQVLTALLLLLQLGCCVAGRNPSLAGLVDFRAFYAAGTILRTGHAAQLYDYAYQQQVQNTCVGLRSAPLPFLYPPFAALWFVPLSFLPYKAAFAVQFVANLLLLFCSAWNLRSTLPWFRAASPLLLPAAFGCFFCVSVALMQGQVSFLLLLVCTVAFSSLQSGQPFSAGLILSLLLIKFQLALPILALMLLWRQWPFCAGFFAGSAFLGLTSWVLVGSQCLSSYAKSILAVGSLVSSNALTAKARFGMLPTDMPNIHGLTFAVSSGGPGKLLNLALCSAVYYFVWRRGPSLLAAVPAAMLVSYHMQPHDLVLLLLPLTATFDRVASSLHSGSWQALFKTRRLLWMPLCLTPLFLPLAPVLMACGVGFLASLSVLAALLLAVRFGPDPLPSTGTEACTESNLQAVA